MEGLPMASSEERRDEPAKELVHKTKTIQFLGRTTPIILQNDNGPCPLLAICNVLLLRNHLSLNPDVTEVSQERLLSLVAERLIDSNSNVDNKDAGYVENQQQNIADAIDLLPRLTTGIDVNTKFRRIDDFEFTSECAIFDLLDIPLYHGWIVDPQDYDTANAIGSKSYNTLMGDLVDLETRYMKGEQEKNSEEDAIDFAAATTATLGVPSPCLSRGRSFDEASQEASYHHHVRKGDMEQEAELLKAIKLSEAELGVVNNSPVVDMSDQKNSCNSNEHAERKNFESTDVVEKFEEYREIENRKNEQAELLEAIKLSEGELGVAVNNSPVVDTSDKQISVNANKDLESKSTDSVNIVGKLEACSEIESRKNDEQEPVSFQDLHALSDSSNQVISSETVSRETDCLKTNQQNHLDEPVSGECRELVKVKDIVAERSDKGLVQNDIAPSDSIGQDLDQQNHLDEPVRGECGELVKVKDIVEERSDKVLVQNDIAPSDSIGQDLVSASEAGMLTSNGGDYEVQEQSAPVSHIGEKEDKQRGCNTGGVSDSSTQGDASSTRRQSVDEPDACSSSAHGSEPIYEGEECILESDSSMCKDREPMYEGEMVLAEQSCKDTKDYDGSSKDELSPRQGELIGKFFKNNASQLTIYGLFCLQDGLKERELGVFFRNNHFNTMFKFDGELYLLATDQGYISQPDLVWEKLNEVNGNSVFMTSNFKEFSVENEVNNNTWDEQNAMASTADFLASVDNSAHLDSSFNSDLQLAIALQQKEFEEQPQRNTQQPTISGNSRLVIGPQVPRSSGRSSSSSVSPRQEPKSPKENKCIVM